MTQWQCVKNCGACCYLNPEERPSLDYFLTPEEMAFYKTLVGVDGWCIHYDQNTRECQIYHDRPFFCRVEPEVFLALYDVPPEELSNFAIECCREHIADLYGVDSPESMGFEQAIS